MGCKITCLLYVFMLGKVQISKLLTQMDDAYNKTSAYDQMYGINQNIIRYIQSPHESCGYHNNPYSSYLLIR
jgi:hypothetical protein